MTPWCWYQSRDSNCGSLHGDGLSDSEHSMKNHTASWYWSAPCHDLLLLVGIIILIQCIRTIIFTISTFRIKYAMQRRLYCENNLRAITKIYDIYESPNRIQGGGVDKSVNVILSYAIFFSVPGVRSNRGGSSVEITYISNRDMTLRDNAQFAKIGSKEVGFKQLRCVAAAVVVMLGIW